MARSKSPVAGVAGKRRAGARPRRRVRLENDERRAQILALGMRAFAVRSYDEVAIDDLAREAKISKGLLYHYFPTKRDLYVAGLREIADDLVAKVTQVTAIAPGAPPPVPAERVRAGLDAYLDHISQHSRAFVSLMRGGIGSDPEVAAVVESVRARLADRFLDGSPFKALLMGNPRFETALRGWIGFVEGASIDWFTHERIPRVELRELLADTLVAILGVAAPAVIAAAAAANTR